MNAPAYEMLWDCRFCGQRKLLGLTHRHCPNCGAQQDANARYFPPDSERIAVQDHVYVGADIVCRYCNNATSRAAKHCGTCGAPLEEGGAVAQRADQLLAAGAGYAGQTAADAQRELSGASAPVAPPLKKKSYLGCFVAAGVVLLLVIGSVLALVLWKKDDALTVSGHTWKRTISVDTFGPVHDSSWCDALPAGAGSVSRHREQRSSKQVPDGQSCSTRKVDNGDGTFHEKQECTPKFKSEPVYDDKCDYTIERWHLARTELAQGSGVSGVHWPDLKLARTGACVGCEREGTRSETYSVSYKDADGQTYGCDFPQSRWGEFSDGSRWSGEVRRLTSTLDCDSLKK
ncbi:MAG TPA: hypothetical protein VGM29_13980 [Polyangiaceae bacterium]